MPNPNLHFMLSGHVHDESRRTDVANGHPVYQMLADYQSRASGGEGWLRILRFVPADSKVYVQTYSPWLNRFESDANSEFQLDFPMAGSMTTVGSANVASGGTATFTPAGLLAGTTYEWQVTVTNAGGKTVTGPVWRFTTAAAPPVNHAPTASGEAYSVQSGNTLTVAAPGVLSNDTDQDGTILTAQLVTNVTHGTLSLASGGGFSYTPAAGYTGSDSFTYRASDGQATSNAATVALTVTAPPAPVTIFTASFNSGQDSFTYLDDTFKGTAQPSSVSGSRVTTGGFTGGALRVLIGGLDNTDVTNMSGGWRRTFTLGAASNVTLSFRYRLDQTANYEADELSQVLAARDSVSVPASPGYVAQVAGNGDGGAVITTGWRLVQYSLGTLAAGSHTVTLGGFNNKKTDSNEQTTILIDDVSMTR